MNTERAAAEAWLDALLVAAAPLTDLLENGPDDHGAGVYDSLMPQGASTPAVVYQFIEGVDTNTQMSARGMTEFPVLVKAVDEGPKAGLSKAVVNQIAGEIDAVLQGASGSDDDYEFDCYRERDLASAGALPAKQFRQAGGLYIVIVRPKA